MQERIAHWQQQYQKLSQREQWLVKLSAAFILIAAFYWLLWSPLTQAVAKEQKALSSQQETLQWVTQNANRAQQLKGAGGQAQSYKGSLPQLVNQSAARLRISISRMQPQGDELLLWVDNAPFNDVLSWLEGLERQGVTILDLDIANAQEPGYIKIRRLQLGKA